MQPEQWKTLGQASDRFWVHISAVAAGGSSFRPRSRSPTRISSSSALRPCQIQRRQTLSGRSTCHPTTLRQPNVGYFTAFAVANRSERSDVDQSAPSNGKISILAQVVDFIGCA